MHTSERNRVTSDNLSSPYAYDRCDYLPRWHVSKVIAFFQPVKYRNLYWPWPGRGGKKNEKQPALPFIWHSIDYAAPRCRKEYNVSTGRKSIHLNCSLIRPASAGNSKEYGIVTLYIIVEPGDFFTTFVQRHEALPPRALNTFGQRAPPAKLTSFINSRYESCAEAFHSDEMKVILFSLKLLATSRAFLYASISITTAESAGAGNRSLWRSNEGDKRVEVTSARCFFDFSGKLAAVSGRHSCFIVTFPSMNKR